MAREKIDLEEIISGADRIGIAGHMHPDGDAVGSSMGLYNYIKTSFSNKDVKVFLRDVPEVFFFFKGYDDIMDPLDYKGDPFDVFFCLDCSDKGRLNDAGPLFDGAKLKVVIDHHISNTAFGDIDYIIPDASSTCELVGSLMKEELITKEVAECIYTGMVHDTGVFQYGSTSRSTMNLAGILMEKGIDYPGIIERTYYEKTFVQNKILGQALLNARLYEDGKIIASVITNEDYKAHGASRSDMEGVVSQLRVTKGAKVAILLYANELKGYKVSLRGSGDTDVNLADIAVRYGGGGHAKAAGLNVGPKAWDEIDKLVIKIREAGL